jgi:hypothetical protein
MCITITIIIVSVSNVFDYYNVKVQHYNNKGVQNSDNNNLEILHFNKAIIKKIVLCT